MPCQNYERKEGEIPIMKETERERERNRDEDRKLSVAGIPRYFTK